jgi:hypothetical protein
MPQTFYIEGDEEIISAISRLRRSQAKENYFVFPKRALILQSIVNLRLFQREAQKVGKKVIVVTQDETGRMLAEKAGIETENYSDDFSQKSERVELSPEALAEPLAAVSKPSQPEAPAPTLPRSGNLGTSDFFQGPRAEGEEIPDLKTAPEPQPVAPAPRALRVRNASPDASPSLNSVRFREAMERKAAPGGALASAGNAVGSAPKEGSPQAPQVRPAAPVPPKGPAPERREVLRKFFAPESMAAPLSAPITPAPARPEPRKPAPAKVAAPAPQPASPTVRHGNFHKILLPLGLLTGLSLVAVASFLFLPKVDVHVTRATLTEKKDLNLKIPFGTPADSEDLVAIKKSEPFEVSVDEDATGTSTGADAKARGTVTLSNDYSEEPQTLVATTRLEAPDGQIFRLTEAVTIPGKSGSTPGTTTANVIADKTGESGNIGPTTFTIPGFKGTPEKYKAFSAASSEPMQGGGNADSDIPTVSKDDLASAEQAADKQAEKVFLDQVRAALGDGERVIEGTVKVTPAEERGSAPDVGTPTEHFTYKRQYQGEVAIIRQEALDKAAKGAAQTDQGGVRFEPEKVTTDFGEVSSNDDGTLSVRLHAELFLAGTVDEQALKEALLGKKADEIEGVLGDFPAVKKIQLVFRPSFLGSGIPASESRVDVILDPVSAE